MVTSQTIFAAMQKLGCRPDNPFFFDDKYALPPKDWVTGALAQSYAANLTILHLKTWVNNKWDCDKFTRKFISIALDAHAISPNAIPDTGIALGYFCYVPDKLVTVPVEPSGHAIVFGAVGDPTAPEIIFFEPQFGDANAPTPIGLVTLTETELWSCFAYAI